MFKKLTSENRNLFYANTNRNLVIDCASWILKQEQQVSFVFNSKDVSFPANIEAYPNGYSSSYICSIGRTETTRRPMKKYLFKKSLKNALKGTQLKVDYIIFCTPGKGSSTTNSIPLLLMQYGVRVTILGVSSHS